MPVASLSAAPQAYAAAIEERRHPPGLVVDSCAVGAALAGAKPRSPQAVRRQDRPIAVPLQYKKGPRIPRTLLLSNMAPQKYQTPRIWCDRPGTCRSKAEKPVPQAQVNPELTD